MRSVIIVSLVVLLGAASTFAFDGKRKGFIVGGGLGFAPSIQWSQSSSYYEHRFGDAKDESGIGINLAIGFAWSKHNMLVYEANGCGYESLLSSDEAVQGVDCFSWYHFYGYTGRSLFTAVGIGFYHHDVSGERRTESGGALLLGGGFEFARHFQMGFYFGSRLNSDGPDVNRSHVNVLFTAFAY